MAYEQVFQQAFIYLIAAVIAVLLGKRLALGSVLGYLIIGAAIGPWGLHFIGHEGHGVTHFAEFGVVVMLFLIGLELHPAMLWKMRRPVLGLGSMQVIVSAAAIAGLAIAFGLAIKPAIAIGLILAMSSTAIVLQTLNEKGLLRTAAGQNAFAVLLFQDIAVIPIMALLPLLGMGKSSAETEAASQSWMAGFPGWAQAILVIGAVVFIILAGRIAMRPMFHAISKTRNREAFTGAALLLVIGVALLMTKVGLSPALGAFVAGVVLAGSEYRHEIESDLEPIKGLLLGLFFLGVGAGIDFGYISEHLGIVLGSAVGLIVIKGLVLFALSKFRNSTGSSLIFSSSLATGGEFAFVLITLALSANVFDPETGRAVVAVVALSMATTPLLILGAEKWVSRETTSKASDREPDVSDEGNPVIICGFGRFGHAVGRLLRNRGFGCTVLDHDSDQVDLLRQLGIPVFYGDASRPELLTTAGAANAKILVIALRDAETTVKIIENAHRHHPHLKIYLRAHSRIEAYEYLSAGEERIYRDTLDSSLRLSVDVLRDLGLPLAAAQRAAEIFREGDEAAVREMAAHRHDRDEHISAGRDAIRSLDELMRKDLEAQSRESA
jgi:monovalent cation:H+ antiporter-2, CPA2 family